MWPQPGALGSVVDYRVSYGTDDWNDDADKFSLRTAIEDVSSRLEMQRQVDEISAVQCRQRSATKSATSKEATARLCARRSQQPRLRGHDHDCPHAGPRVTAGGEHLEERPHGAYPSCRLPVLSHRCSCCQDSAQDQGTWRLQRLR